MTHLVLEIGLIIAFLSFFAQSDEGEDFWNKNHELREKLMKNYDKHALPQKNVNGTTDVYVLMRPRAIWVNDEKETLTVNSWMAFYWRDKRLKWDHKDFGGLRRIHFGDAELWKPDIAVVNNADITEVDHYGNTHFLVFKSGGVIWVPPATMTSYCPLDLTYWPFDEHKCKIKMASWTTHGAQVNLLLWHNRTQVYMHAYKNMSTSWYVKNATQTRNLYTWEGIDIHFMDIDFEFDIQRRMPAFSACVVIPAIMLPLLLLFQFILPVDHPKRFTIGCTSVLLVLLELIFLKFSVPRLGKTTPVIVKYYGQCLILTGLTVGLTAFLSRLCHSQDPMLAFPPPEILKRVLKGPLAIILCLRDHATMVGLSGKMEEDGEVLAIEEKTPNYSHEWLFVAKAADRLVVIVMLTIFIFSLIGYVAPLK